MTLNFIVVGTGRCGTLYISEVLSQMGIACGHEWVYSPHGRRNAHVPIVGDSSAQAAPFARTFDGFVFHQVRDPLKVIGSFMGFGLFHDYRRFGLDGEFMARHFRFTGDPLADAMRYYVEWNERCERDERYIRYRVEDIDRSFLRQMANAVGVTVEDDAIDRALDAVPRNRHTYSNAHRLTWDDLPRGRARQALAKMSARYGYQDASESATLRVDSERMTLPAWLRMPRFSRSAG